MELEIGKKYKLTKDFDCIVFGGPFWPDTDFIEELKLKGIKFSKRRQACYLPKGMEIILHDPYDENDPYDYRIEIIGDKTDYEMLGVYKEDTEDLEDIVKII